MSERSDSAEIRDWFTTWDGYVRARDYESARELFHPDVVGFGTHMRVVSGLEHLEQNQWRNVWGTIADFRFLVDELQTGLSGDGLQAWAVVPWTSTGYHEDGSTFDRPGRATVVFTRETPTAPWRAIHTHISLAPGTPQRSYGRFQVPGDRYQEPSNRTR
jgi:ketosteroid isomerase-like protein